MFAVLRDNWRYKLLALVFAVGLHAYVVGQTSASQPRMMLVSLKPHNAPPDLLIDEKSLPQITVTLDGSADDVAHVPEGSVTASVDLSHAHAGINSSLPVHISLPTSFVGTVTAEAQPSTVPLLLQPKSHRRLPIIAVPPGTVPAGYAFRAPQVSPRFATVEGSRSAVEAVRQLVIKNDDDAPVGTVDDTFPIIALDSDDSQVEGVIISPATAHVRIEMMRPPVSKTLLISPSVVGAPAFPARITDIQVNPSTLLVTGRADRLTQVGTLSTAPVDVSGATSDVVRQVSCAPPPGLSPVGSGLVTVTVRISAAPPAPAPGTPANTAPPAPAVSTAAPH